MTATQDSLETGAVEATSLDALMGAPATAPAVGDPGDGGAGGGTGGGGGSHQAPAAPAGSRRRMKIFIAILAVLLLLVAAIFAWYLITRKPLAELPGLSREAMPHYSTSIYGVTAPLGVAVTPDGSRIYVTQSEGPRVVSMFDAQGNALGTFTAPRVAGKGHIPVYLTIDPLTGQVWVTDRLTSQVYVYSANGAYVRTFAPLPVSKTWQPLGIAFDAKGNLFITDVSGTTQKLLEFDANGALTRSVTARDPMAFPNGVAVDDQGRVAVADSNNGRLLLFDGQGNQVNAINRGVGNGDLGLPRGVAWDQDGRIYVVDTTNHALSLYRLSDDGKTIDFLGQVGQQGIGDGMFMYPNGIATDQHGRVYITDRVNNRLQIWSF
jgi:DNA-binding beta-propeller fold protein YncE